MNTPESFNPNSDPAAVIDWLEESSPNVGDPHWKQFEELITGLLKKYGDIDASGDAELIRQTTGGMALETVARQAGWIMGFQYFAQMLATAQGGAK